MALDITTTNVDAGDDAEASWADQVRADIGNLFADKEIYTETDGATITFDMDNGAVQIVTVEGDRNLRVSNTKSGRTFFIIIQQDGTGGRTVGSWWSTLAGTNIYWDRGVTPTLSSGADKYDMFAFTEVATNTYLGFIVGQNMG